MNRRDAVRALVGATMVAPALSRAAETAAGSPRPLAITMWEFSWLERRWPGAGYESWERALDELVERGYDAVRIDAFPHLVAKGATRAWELVPVWNQHMWGSPARVTVTVLPALTEFIASCRARGVRVGLSSWFREDTTNARMTLTTPEAMAASWIATLRAIDAAGLLDAIFYLDCCNEWPGELWAPYFRNDPPELTWGGWHTATSLAWMRRVIDLVRGEFPALPVCFSFDGMDDSLYGLRDLRHFDLLEHHTWMAKENGSEFNRATEYGFQRFESTGYENLVAHAERLYRARPQHWQDLLTSRIASLAEASRRTGLPLGTTECWAIIDYKDWPGLPWDWVKELCALGTETAAATGRWAFIATSNFCGPQFAGMWRDVAWHQRLTACIRQAAIARDLCATKLAQRLHA